MAKKFESPIIIGNGMIGDIFSAKMSSNVEKVHEFDKEFRGQLVAGGKLREIAKAIKSFVMGNKTPAALLVLTLLGKSKFLSTVLKDESMVDHVLKVEINLDWTAIVGSGCSGLELDQVASIEVLGQIIPRIDLGNLRTKKKRPRRIKKERRIKQTEKAGIG